MSRPRLTELVPADPRPSENERFTATATGSAALQRECEALFWRFARRHHVTPDEARVLLVGTGVRL